MYQAVKIFFAGADKAALWGGLGAAASFGVGAAFGAAGSFGHKPLRAGAHGLTQGGISAAQGSNFWQGALSGAKGSGISSGIDALGGSAGHQILGGGLSGGIGSDISGGNFWQGFRQGIAVGAFNHALHEGLRSGDLVTHPIDPETKKPYLPGFPDAEYQVTSKGAGNREVWKLKNGKFLEWTSKNGVVEMYDKTGKKWLGKYNPLTGKLIDASSKMGRVASFVGKGINFISNRLSVLSNIIIYTGPGSGFENHNVNNNNGKM